MINFLDVINIVGILGTSVISTITLFTTRALQRSQQKASVMANKRSERIDLLREYSAGIISCGKQFLYDLATQETKTNLISYTDKFNSLLQYAYVHDVELIDSANGIVDACLAKKIDKKDIRLKITDFWKMCDVYVGVEYERLKIESMGDIKGSGEVQGEALTFEDLHKVFLNQQNEFISAGEKNKES